MNICATRLPGRPKSLAYFGSDFGTPSSGHPEILPVEVQEKSNNRTRHLMLSLHFRWDACFMSLQFFSQEEKPLNHQRKTQSAIVGDTFAFWLFVTKRKSTEPYFGLHWELNTSHLAEMTEYNLIDTLIELVTAIV